MNKLKIINISFLKIALTVLFAVYAVISYTQNVTDIIVKITFENAPTSYSAVKAPLKYNKKFALSMQIDDGNSSIFYNGFPVFQGGQVGTTNYPGMMYSDGCSNLHSFKITSAIFMFSGVGTDLHNDPGGEFITWQQLDTLYQNNWGIANHGVNSDAFDSANFIKYSIARNKSYCRRKMYNTTPGGVITSVFVNPNGNSTWTDPAFEQGNICALNENHFGPLGNYGGNVNDSTLNWATNRYNLVRINTGNQDVTDLVDSLVKQSVNGAHYWCPIYTHNIYTDYKFADFVADFDYIENNYGSNGSDEILMTTDEEILDYLIVRDGITVNKSWTDNILTLTFSGSLPSDLLYYASSIVVNSDQIITDISVQGTQDFTASNVGDTSALINLNWDEHIVLSAETLAADFTSTAVATQTKDDALIAMDYVTVLDYGTVKYDLVSQLCQIPGVTYDEGFCNSGYPDFVNITGDSIILTGQYAVLTATSFLDNYLWSNDQVTQSITVSPQSDTKYWVQAVTKDTVTVSDTIQVVVSDSYIIAHSPLLVNHVVDVPDSLWVTIKSGASNLWSTGSTLNYIIVNPSISTLYHIDVLVADTVVNQLDFDVYIANVVDFTYDTVCLGDSTTFINKSTVNDSIIKILWDLNGDTQFDDAEGDTVYYTFSTPGNHLAGMRVYFKTDPMDVAYNAVPVGDLPNVDFKYSNTCQGSTTLFTDLSTIQIGTLNHWDWNFGDGKMDTLQNTSNYFIDIGSYNVSLTATSSVGCKDSLQKTVVISSTPTITLKVNGDSIINNNDTAFFAEGGKVSILVSNFSSYDSVIWFDDSRSASVVIAEEGSFFVYVYQNGCDTRQTFYTSWGSSPHPPPSGNDIMNLFTPNGDGFNDVWLISNPKVILPAKVNVYNRSGKLIFSDSNYQNTWEGQYKGNPLPQATYYYIIEDASGQTFKGAVTIIR